MPPLFVTVGRAAGAGLLSLLWLASQRAPSPRRSELRTLVTSALGTVPGFPLFLALGGAVRVSQVQLLLPFMAAAVCGTGVG